VSTKTRKTEVGTRLPKVGTGTTTAPVVPNPTPEERGNVQFATVQPGSFSFGGPGTVSGWKGVTFPTVERMTLRGDCIDVSGLYLTTGGTGRVMTRTATDTRGKGERKSGPVAGTPRGDGPTLDGFSLSSVVRWCGSQGYTAGPVGRAITAGWGVEPNPSTVATQVQHGRKGNMSIPVLPPDLQIKLRELITNATK
jgi:hypothetical protein